MLPTGARFRALYNKNGLTPAGQYYYNKTGIAPPGRFDYQQDSIRKGRSQYIKLLDGTQRKVSTWDSVGKEWKLTALGRTFYAKAVDRYTVLWPVQVALTRINGSIFEREDWMPSTAIDALGEIEVPKSLSEAEQRTRVAQIERAWRDAQPTVEGRKVLLPGYETYTLDTSREIQYNKLSVGQQGDVQATMHRPLREGRPWAFHGLEGVSDAAYEETDGQCVSHQLARHIRIKGKDAPWTQQQVAEMLVHATEALYEQDDENDPYDGGDASKIGFTAAAVVQLCRDLGAPVHIKWGGAKIESYTPEHSQYEAVALYIWGDHCFCVGDPATAKSIAREQVSAPTAQPNEVLATIGRRVNTMPASQYWETYSKLAPGHFQAPDLLKVRAALLREGICPQVRLSGTGHVKALRYNDCHVHAWPKEAHICLKFLEELSAVRAHSLQYRGESLATFCQMIFDEFCRQCDRPFLTPELKRELAGRQAGKCAVCGDPTVAEVDHTVPRSCFGADGPDNYRYLCALCHKQKTADDHQRLHVEDPNPYMSRFNEETWEGFVLSRKPTQVVCDLHAAMEGAPTLEIDVRSCRLNGIIEGNVLDISIYSPLDEFTEPKLGTVADYSWVDLGAVRSPLKLYIWDGPRWYDKASVQFMLETGQCRWCDIKLAFDATTHRPASDLASKLKKIRGLWQSVGGSFEAHFWAGERARKKDTKELLAKTALLNLLGTWGRCENYRYHMTTTSHPDDLMWNGEVESRPTPCSEQTAGGTYIFNDVTYRQKLLNLGTFLPLNLIGRSQERLQVARALLVIRQCSELRRVLSIQVDGIYTQPCKRDLPKIQRSLRALKYCELPRIGRPLAKGFTRVRQEPCQSQEYVYKCNELAEPRFPGGTLKIADHVDPPYHEELEWNDVTEPTEGPDDFVDKVLEHVRAGKSFTCLGAPGTGKSKGILAKVREDLLARGERVVCLAPTHAAARQLPEGDTIHHFVGKHAMRGTYRGWILLDEVSMCVLPVLAALDQLRLGGTKIATFGDWDQLPPVGNSWRGHPVDAQAFRESRLYKLWSDGTMFRLARCRRSDEAHFRFYTGLSACISNAIAAVRIGYGGADNADADLHVCISHRRRRAIAHEIQGRLAEGRECVEIPAGDDPAFPCFVGTKLVGNATAGRIVNGGRYTVTAIGGGKISLSDDLTSDAFEVSLEACGKCCLLGHAMVYNKVQGATESGTVMLHDTGSKYFKRCHLYVGLSRVTDGANVFVGD